MILKLLIVQGLFLFYSMGKIKHVSYNLTEVNAYARLMRKRGYSIRY